MGTLALLVFFVIVLAILSGYPVAISLGGVSLVAGYFLLGPAFMQFLPSRVVGVLSNYVLLAVPMFIVMGLALQRSGLAESLMKGLACMMGGLRGGLAIAVLLVGALSGSKYRDRRSIGSYTRLDCFPCNASTRI